VNQPASPQLSGLSAFPELRLDFSAASIVHPANSDYAAVAKNLVAALRSLTGASPGIMTEDAPAAIEGVKLLVVLGNMMESALVRRLYFECYDFTDWAFPGSGGFTLRTIRDPFSNGTHVVLVGGSDIDGVRLAAVELVAEIKRSGAVLGYFNRVVLGRWTKAEELSPARLLADTDELWQRTGDSGSWEYMERIGLCGVGYLRTGDEHYLRLFQRELHYFRTHDVYAPNPEAPQQIHGRIFTLLTVWDLVCDHPIFTAGERREFHEMFLYLARSGEGVAQIRESAKTFAVRFNHDTRAALDAFFLGRYFDRRHQLPEAQEWLALAAAIFAPQLVSGKPAEDSWGHQWEASMLNTLVYALAAGRSEYLKSDALRQSAERALLAHGVNGPRVYLAACAAVTGDVTYLSCEAPGDAQVRDAAQLCLTQTRASGYEEMLRSFMASSATGRRAELTGLAVAPLDPLWHATIETPSYNPDGIFAVKVTPEEGFDKIAIREGWDEKDFYLLLDGISGGLHSYEDANCLVWLREGGVDWFLPRGGYQRALGVRAQNGVNAVFDGRGAGRMHRYAKLLYRDQNDEYFSYATVQEGLGATSWERHVLRSRSQWTLVLDRVRAEADGELLVERFWYPQGERSSQDERFVCTQKVGDRTVQLQIASTVSAAGREVTAEGLRERRRVAIRAGHTVTLAALLWTDGENGSAAWHLGQTEDGFEISDTDETLAHVSINQIGERGCGLRVREKTGERNFGHAGETETGVEPEGLALVPAGWSTAWLFRECDLTMEKITAVATYAGSSVVGTESGVVIFRDASGNERWRVQLLGAISALEISGCDTIVGEGRGALSRIDEQGKRVWTVAIPWVTLPWAYWSESRSSIREIGCADLDGDGHEEILVSNADRRVYAFDREGRELWKRPIQWGVFTAMWPGRSQGKFALFGGTARPSIHGYVVVLGADGAVSGHLSRGDLTCWSIPSNIRDLWQGDIDHDGELEIITVVDTNCRQLLCYAADGAVKWDCDLGASGGALAVDPHSRRVYASSDAGYVTAVEGLSGRRLWYRWIGEIAELVWVLPDSSLLAVAQRGAIWRLGPDGEVWNYHETGTAITAIPRAGNHRGTGRELILGTAAGRVLSQALGCW